MDASYCWMQLEKCGHIKHCTWNAYRLVCLYYYPYKWSGGYFFIWATFFLTSKHYWITMFLFSIQFHNPHSYSFIVMKVTANNSLEFCFSPRALFLCMSWIGYQNSFSAFFLLFHMWVTPQVYKIHVTSLFGGVICCTFLKELSRVSQRTNAYNIFLCLHYIITVWPCPF